jgi:hypothetical protein
MIAERSDEFLLNLFRDRRVVTEIHREAALAAGQ